MSHEKIHAKAVLVAARFKQSEIELIEILEEVWTAKTFYYFECKSLFEYSVNKLNLSPEVTNIFNKIAKKTLKISGFKEQIRDGHISISNASRICSVITPENKEHWFKLAMGPKAKLEREIALASPQSAIKEKITPKAIGDNVRIELRFGISEEHLEEIKRAQDLLSQQLGRAATLEDVSQAAVSLLLCKIDPLRKGQGKTSKRKSDPNIRSDSHPNSTPSPTSESCPGTNDTTIASEMSPEIPSVQTSPPAKPRRQLKVTIKRQIHHKNESQCSHVDSNGSRCQERRHLHIHHIKPLSEGGTNEINNLTIFCSGHHRAHHFNFNGHK